MHRRLLALARDTRISLTITVLSGLVAGLLTIGQAWLLSGIINGVFLEGQTLTQVIDWLQLFLVIIFGRALLVWVNEVSANDVAVRVKTNLRKRLFAHIQALGPGYTRGERTGELTAAAVEGIEALDAYFSQYLPQLVITALIPVSILIFVFPLDLLSGVILLVTAPLIPFFMILIGKGAEAITNNQYETLSRLSAHFLDSLQGLTTLKVFGQSKAHSKSISDASDQFRDKTMTVLRITFLSALVLELLATLSTAVIAVEIGLRLLYANMGFREAFFLLILAPEFYLPLRMLGLRFHSGMAGTSAARRIFDILDTPAQTADNKPQTIIRRPLSIVWKNISFTYPGESTPALESINFQIQAGQHIALVGPSGAGKSTLINLLLGFYQPSSGQIITTYQPRSTVYRPPSRDSIAWVSQHPYLFHDSIATNIRFGKPDAPEDVLIAAAQATHLHEFILSLPEGYETVIGEGGARLSAGQAQRLALARAFLKDAPILILDEPTSSLDPDTESLIEESTRQLMQGRTTITIAHRLNTVFRADKIVVLDKGQIVEHGGHSLLMRKNGAYAGMANALRVERGLFNIQTGSATTRYKQPASFNLQPLTNGMQTSGTKNKTNTLAGLLGFLGGSWNLVALSVLLGVLTIGANISLMGSSAWLISAAALHPSIAELQVAIVGVRFFGLSRGVFRYAERLVSHNVSLRLLARLRIWVYQKLEPLAPARLIDFRAGDLLSRILGDVETLENFYIRVVSPALVAMVILIGVYAFLASIYPLLAVVMLGLFLCVGLILPVLSRFLGRDPGKALITLRSELKTLLVDGIQGLPEILAFGRADDSLRLITNKGVAYSLTQRRTARISGFFNGLTTLLTNLGLWMVVYLAIPQVTVGHISGTMLASLALLTVASFEAFAPLPIAAQMWESVRAAAERLFEIVDLESVVDQNKELREESCKKENLSSNLELSNLSFHYSNQTTLTLQNISFKLDSGKSLAIVGPSGAGKSTILNLLLRFWEYDSGDIFLGSISLKDLEQDQIREQFAVVSQNPFFFNASIRDNLKLACPYASMPEIENIAKQAQIHNFIACLPKGYETFIGEKGIRLSAGERQRLAIARALLKDAPFLILDEPTANLDALNEKQVLDTLFGVLQDKTTLLITHRLVGLEKVDEILVMDHGRIVECGTQNALIRQAGTFSRLWQLQNQIFSNNL